MAPIHPDGTRRRARHPALQAGSCYFLAMLTLGWICQPVRDYWVRAGADPMLAILSQVVVSLLVLVWVAGWVVEAFDVPDAPIRRASVGFGAIGFFVAYGVLAGYLLSGITPWALAVQLLSAEGLVIAVSLLIAAALPMVRGRRVAA